VRRGLEAARPGSAFDHAVEQVKQPDGGHAKPPDSSKKREFQMAPDIDHDGGDDFITDALEAGELDGLGLIDPDERGAYYDDVGGAYHFAPDDIKRDLTAPPSPGMVTAVRVLTMVFWIVMLSFLLWFF
jgi:hypothetical protein